MPALRVTPLLHSTSGWLRASAAGSELRGKRHAKFAGCGIRSADTSTLRRRAVVSLVTGRRKPADREIEGRSESPAVASFCLGFPATDLLFSGVHTHTHTFPCRGALIRYGACRLAALLCTLRRALRLQLIQRLGGTTRGFMWTV